MNKCYSRFPGKVHGSWTVLDVDHETDTILAVCSAPNRPPAALIGTLPEVGKEDRVFHLFKSLI